MHGSRSKLPSKKSRQAALRGGFNSSVKGLKTVSEQQANYVMAIDNIF
jgi:hypothetical protein